MPNAQQPAKAAWNLESFRLTAFLESPIDDVDSHWKSIIGTQPERSATQRVSGNTVHIAEDEHPQLRRVALQVDGTMTKADWFLGAVSVAGSEPLPPAGLVLSSDIWQQLSGFCANWSARYMEPTRRLAIGMTLLGEAYEKRSDGYTALAGFIPAVTLDPDSSDFQYRINRPRPSQVLPTTINRVMLWSVAAIYEATADVSKGDVRTALSFRPRAQLDINTSGDYAGSITDAEAVLAELLDFAKQIAELGDHK